MNNVYYSVSVAPNTPTELGALTVPARSGYSLTGIRVYSLCETSWTLYLNGVAIVGGLTGAANPNDTIAFPTVWGMSAFNVALISVSHTETTNQTISATLFYEQL